MKKQNLARSVSDQQTTIKTLAAGHCVELRTIMGAKAVERSFSSLLTTEIPAGFLDGSEQEIL